MSYEPSEERPSRSSFDRTDGGTTLKYKVLVYIVFAAMWALVDEALAWGRHLVQGTLPGREDLPLAVIRPLVQAGILAALSTWFHFKYYRKYYGTLQARDPKQPADS